MREQLFWHASRAHNQRDAVLFIELFSLPVIPEIAKTIVLSLTGDASVPRHVSYCCTAYSSFLDCRRVEKWIPGPSFLREWRTQIATGNKLVNANNRVFCTQCV